MKTKCLACGVVKDTESLEVYPYADDGIDQDGPIKPLFVLECQGPRTGEGDAQSEWRAVIVCHTCLHRLQPDLWISEQCWLSLSPLTPYGRLPLVLPATHKSDRFDVETYARMADQM